jgi:hypothetical protein
MEDDKCQIHPEHGTPSAADTRWWLQIWQTFEILSFHVYHLYQIFHRMRCLKCVLSVSFSHFPWSPFICRYRSTDTKLTASVALQISHCALLKMEATCPSEAFVTTHRTTSYHNPEYHICILTFFSNFHTYSSQVLVDWVICCLVVYLTTLFH